MTEIERIANQKWNITIDADDASASIWRDDPTRRGCRIGPLARLPLGMGSTMDDGTPVACLRDGEDGLILWAVQQLPKMLRLLLQIEKDGEHCENSSFAAHFLVRGLRSDAVAILDRIRNRPDELPSGDVYEVEASDE